MNMAAILIWSQELERPKCFHHGGRHSIKSRSTYFTDIDLLRRLQRKSVFFLRSVGLDPRIIDIFWTEAIIGDPRDANRLSTDNPLGASVSVPEPGEM